MRYLILLAAAIVIFFANTNKATSAVLKLNEKRVAQIWSSIPFFSVGDLDQASDVQTSQNISNMGFALESQFKAALDQFFIENDVRDSDRRVQISSSDQLGKLDYAAYGTFSSLGNDQFQLTFHLQNIKDGSTRNFISRGLLVSAVDDLALQVFDFFQKNIYADWQPKEKQLEWLPMPSNVNSNGYTFDQAKSYCFGRGYRLPFSRELLMASSGGVYKAGGISHLEDLISYAIADRRRVNSNYVLIPGFEQYTGGILQPDSSPSRQGRFWCVKGSVSDEIKIMEKLWELYRQYRNSNKDIFIAIETLRFELGDSDTESSYFGSQYERIERLSGIDEALQVLYDHNIVIEIPDSLRPRP